MLATERVVPGPKPRPPEMPTQSSDTRQCGERCQALPFERLSSLATWASGRPHARSTKLFTPRMRPALLQLSAWAVFGPLPALLAQHATLRRTAGRYLALHCIRYIASVQPLPQRLLPAQRTCRLARQPPIRTPFRQLQGPSVRPLSFALSLTGLLSAGQRSTISGRAPFSSSDHRPIRGDLDIGRGASDLDAER